MNVEQLPFSPSFFPSEPAQLRSPQFQLCATKLGGKKQHSDVGYGEGKDLHLSYPNLKRRTNERERRELLRWGMATQVREWESHSFGQQNCRASVYIYING